MARFTKLASGVWGVRLTPEEAVSASKYARVTVTKQDGTTKQVTLAGLVAQKAAPGGALLHADWSIREERKVSAYRGRGRPRRDYLGASLASQTASYDLAEPRPAPAPSFAELRASAAVAEAFPADPNDAGAWFAPGADDRDLGVRLTAPIVRRGDRFYDRVGWFVLPRPSAAVAVAERPLGYSDALLFAAEYEADEDVFPGLLARPTLLVGFESTLTRE